MVIETKHFTPLVEEASPEQSDKLTVAEGNEAIDALQQLVRDFLAKQDAPDKPVTRSKLKTVVVSGK